ncbi:MAG TPA: hypothetical protein PKY81_04260 [bacterium]|nr:hypothetical protein [bacterium]HPN30150.1 hypothetical protein [bacterium]
MAKKNAGKKKKQKIEIVIDDAGSGNFVGGMIIAGFADGIDKYKGCIISPDEYNDKQIEMQIKVLKCVEEIIAYFSEHDIVSVFLCQSNLFDKSALHLVDKGYVVIRGRVEGKLQDLIEDDFMNHLKSFGMPEYVDFFAKIIMKDKNSGYRMLNSFCINFIKADLKNRLKYCKSHCKLYEDLMKAVVHRDVIENKFGSKLKLCANCGRHIRDKELYKYTTSSYNASFYSHIDCARQSVQENSGAGMQKSGCDMPF